MTKCNVIKLISFHFSRTFSKIQSTVFFCPKIPVQLQSAFQKKFGNFCRIKAKGPRFAQFRNIAKKVFCAKKSHGTVKDSRMDIGEDQPASRGKCTDIPENSVHCLICKIVCDALPQEQGRTGCIETFLSQFFRQELPVEINLHEPDVLRQFRYCLAQFTLFFGKHVRVINFKNNGGTSIRKPVRPAIITGAENHNLTDPLMKSPGPLLIDKAGPGNSRGACSRQSDIGICSNKKSKQRDFRERNCSFKGGIQKGYGERIVKEARCRRT